MFLEKIATEYIEYCSRHEFGFMCCFEYILREISTLGKQKSMLRPSHSVVKCQKTWPYSFMLFWCKELWSMFSYYNSRKCLIKLVKSYRYKGTVIFRITADGTILPLMQCPVAYHITIKLSKNISLKAFWTHNWQDSYEFYKRYFHAEKRTVEQSHPKLEEELGCPYVQCGLSL